MSLDPVQREIYEAEVKAFMVDQIQLKTAEEKGVQQGLRLAVLQMMAGRLGNTPKNVVDGLNGLGSNELSVLIAEFFKLNSYDDVEAWLTRH